MGIIILMVIASVSLAAVFLILFIIGAKKGQFDEDESPAVRMLKDDKKIKDKIDT
jgi:cbb3-type cytochrome oxidase maturation protein